MPSDNSRPLLNPVLKFTRDPRPRRVAGGGKSATSIQVSRLSGQRNRLHDDLRKLLATAPNQPQFNNRVIVYAAMFDDSLAPSYTPDDLFSSERGARLIAPYRSGYLIEVETKCLKLLASAARGADRIVDRVDISRVQSVRYFGHDDATGLLDVDQAWAIAPKIDGGKVFLAWIMPLRNDQAGEELLERLEALRDDVIAAAPPLLAGRFSTEEALPPPIRRSLRLSTGQNRLTMAFRAYRQTRRAVTTVVIPTRSAFLQLIASGTVFRLEPVAPISSTSPGVGREPTRPLPSSMEALPVVAVVDGGLSAQSYKAAEAWSAPSLVDDVDADRLHGNRVTSLIVQGHDWNNKLFLPHLYCKVGTVQAVPKLGSGVFLDPQDVLAYLDAVMTAYPNTKVWNFSCNQPSSCDPEMVSYLGHGIAVLARKHKILPIVSVGNKPGDLLQPPADCEAAITIGGRMHNSEGKVAGPCPVSLCGPGPSNMLKPEYSYFSKVRVLGGLITSGSSYATALTSPLAAHTMQRLRDPEPDAAKALLLHRADGVGFDTALGFGSAGEVLPWECPKGAVTLEWSAGIRPGAAYYWELPIPSALIVDGKLHGHGKLTAVLNPHPLVSDLAGPNYFSSRVETALQVIRDEKAHNVLGALDTRNITEAQARAYDHKWSPVRQHLKTFKGVSFHGNTMRVYARVYVRDIYLYGLDSTDEVPPLNVVFVLTLGTDGENGDIYEELRADLGTFVESAVVDLDVDIDNE